jgi:hypothetical protein
VTDGLLLREPLPGLVEPVLIVMLSGWIDASNAAANAMAAIREECECRVVGTFDPDLFIDYRARRPTMELRDGVNTRLVWSEIELAVGRDVDGRDVLTLSGPEPDSQWRRFASSVAALAGHLGATTMVTLGAYPFASPHTRPARLSCSSPSADVVDAVPFLKNSVDVPAGMGAVLEHALTDVGVPSLGLWVQVPHYLSTMAHPEASVALLNGLQHVAGVRIAATKLRDESTRQRVRLDDLVAANDEHLTMVRQLEVAYDATVEEAGHLDPASLPSGDELAADFERFLREQDS